MLAIPMPGFAEPFSSLSHLAGAVVFTCLAVLLLRSTRGNRRRTLALLVYTFGVVFALTMSGVFHLLDQDTTARLVLQRLDHAAIFFLIAASYTPVHVIQFRGFLRWGILLLIWAAAITGMVLKTVLFDTMPQSIGLGLYLALGWFGLFSGAMLWLRSGFRPLLPLLGGALAYTLGALIDADNRLVLIPGVLGPHAIFHLFVLAGVALHWRYISTISRHAVIMDQWQ